LKTYNRSFVNYKKLKSEKEIEVEKIEIRKRIRNF
jgi:hypothetical protein